MPTATHPDGAFRVVVAVPPGIVRLSWAPGLCITGPLAVAARVAVDNLNGDRPRPLLVQMTGVDTPTREARAQFGYRCTAPRIALLGESAVDRIRAIFAPPGGGGFAAPTQFFTSEVAALAWLLDTASDVGMDLPSLGP